MSKIDWAGLILGRKFTVFLCFTPYLRAISKFKSSGGRRGGGGLYLEGLFKRRVFCVTILSGLYLEGLIHGGANFRKFTVLIVTPFAD